MFFSPEFLAGDDERAIAEHHDGFEKMSQDWLKNKETGDFEESKRTFSIALAPRGSESDPRARFSGRGRRRSEKSRR